MRLDKFLIEAGLGSRTEVKQLLKKKQICVNDKIETSAKRQIDASLTIKDLFMKNTFIIS